MGDVVDPPPVRDLRHLVPDPENIYLSKFYSKATRNRLIYETEGVVTLNDNGHHKYPFSAKLYSEPENINFKIIIGNKKSINSMRIQSLLSPNGNKLDVVGGYSSLSNDSIGYGPLVIEDDKKIEKYLGLVLNDKTFKKELKKQIESGKIKEDSFSGNTMKLLGLFYLDG